MRSLAILMINTVVVHPKNKPNKPMPRPALLACLTFLLITVTASALPESHYQAIAAKILDGQTEVTMPDHSRCDIVTETHAIEVDHSGKWAQSLGQSLNYAFQANKRAGIVLILNSPTDTTNAIRVNSLIQHYKLPITLWTIDKETEALKQFSTDSRKPTY